MNLRWNNVEKRFEAEFSADFQGDLDAVKAAGFRTTGPPDWVWHTLKIPVLDAIRTTNRPASNVTINDDAKEIYLRLKGIEDKNAEVKKALAEERKRQKKLKKLDEKCNWLPEGKEYLTADDLAPCEPPEPRPAYPDSTGPPCVHCGSRIWFYEKQDPPTCLYCEILLDKARLTCDNMGERCIPQPNTIAL